MNETLRVGTLSFDVRRSERRRTFALTVERDGGLRVYAPAGTAVDELEDWVHGKMIWVHQKLALKSETVPKRNEPEFVSGESFSFLGRLHRLKVVDTQKVPLRLDSGTFFLRRIDRGKAEQHFKEWYKENGLSWLEERLRLYSPRVGLVATCVRMRELGYRWASSTKSKTILFNWRLLQLPSKLVDYVIVHELVHLKEAHHGPKFWRTLELALPDWRIRQRELMLKAKEYVVFDVSRRR